MSRHPEASARGRAFVRPPGSVYAEVLDAWLGAGPRSIEARVTAATGRSASRETPGRNVSSREAPRQEAPAYDAPDWQAPRWNATQAYDTADQGLPDGVRVVVREGSRRLMFDAAAYEILLRVVLNELTQQHDLTGQILYEGLPFAGAAVQANVDGTALTTATDDTGGFRLPPLTHGMYGLSIAVRGAVLTVPPIDLR